MAIKRGKNLPHNNGLYTNEVSHSDMHAHNYYNYILGSPKREVHGLRSVVVNNDIHERRISII